MMARRRIYRDSAAKQRAYRRRKNNVTYARANFSIDDLVAKAKALLARLRMQ
jgi:hypothetical protein